MAKDKDERVATCLNLAAAARAALACESSGEIAAARGSVAPTRTAVALPIDEGGAPDDVASEGKPPRRRALVGAVAGAVAIALAIGGFLLFSGGDDTPGGGATLADTRARVTVVALDGNTGELVTERTDNQFTQHLWRILRVEDGSLWQATEGSLVRRNPTTGAVQDTISIPAWQALDSGFGFVWSANHYSPGLTELDRISPLCGEVQALRIEGDLVDMRTGNGAV